jgi:hypothetical protein
MKDRNKLAERAAQAEFKTVIIVPSKSTWCAGWAKR